MRYLQRRAQVLGVGLHPVEQALLVSYRLEAAVLGQLGDPMLADQKECQKVIRLRSLSSATNAAQLAREVIGRSQLLTSAHQSRVQTLIGQLQRRSESNITDDGIRRISAAKNKPSGNPALSSSNTLRTNSRQPKTPPSVGNGNCRSPLSPPSGSSFSFDSVLDESTSALVAGGVLDDVTLLPEAFIGDTETYMELLYEEMSEKQRGALMLLKLARQSDLLLTLSKNEMLMEVLSRTLREEWKKSAHLSTTILSFFFCLSAYSDFHRVIADYKIGSLTMEIMNSQLRQRQSRGCNSSASSLTASGNDSSAVAGSQKSKDIDTLLEVCVELLMNLAEDIHTEHKMQRRGIVTIMAHCLSRDSSELRLSTVRMLRKLSIYRESVHDMAAVNLIESLAVFVTDKSDDALSTETVRLMYNLSFHTALRHQIVANPVLIAKLVQLLSSNKLHQPACGALYNISCDDDIDVASSLAAADCVTVSAQLLLGWSEPITDPALSSLVINLVSHAALTCQLCETVGVRQLLARAVDNNDQQMAQLVAIASGHVTQQPSVAAAFLEVVGPCTEALVNCNNAEIQYELLSILANIAIDDVDFNALSQSFSLIPWLKRALESGGASSGRPVTLGVLKLLGTACASAAFCTRLMEADIFQTLVSMLNDRQEDDEIVLHLVFIFHQASYSPATQHYLIKNTDCFAYLVDLLHDKHALIRAICCKTLELVARESEELAGRLIEARFSWHNDQWLDMIENGASSVLHQTSADSIVDDDFADLVPYLRSDDDLCLSDTSSELSLEMASHR